jgi:hypothetical protein
MHASRSALRGTIVLAAATAASLASTMAPASAAPIPTAGFTGYAYGSYVAGPSGAAVSGTKAIASVGCTTAGGAVSTNQSAASTIPVVGSTGTVTSKVTTSVSGATRAISATSTTNGINLLGGLVTASSVVATSKATSTSGTSAGSAASSVTGLKVGGVAVSSSSAPNTIIDLKVAGESVGRVMINQQVKGASGNQYTVDTTALSITIVKNTKVKLAAGTLIVVGRARAALTPATIGYVAGIGFATKSTSADGKVISGATAAASLGCTGGSSTNSFASSTVTSLLTTGAASTTATATVGRSVSVDVVNRVGTLKVLSTVIGANTITAHTSASKMGTGAAVLHDTSAFAGLTIKGVAYANTNVHPNTVMKVAGLGTITLHKVSRTATALTVTMIEIKLDHSIGNLSNGSTIAIGYSSSSIVAAH